MAKGGSSANLLLGLAIGVGLGLVAGLLLDPNSGARRRARLAERAREVANGVASLPGGSGTWRQRKNARAERTFMSRVERIRTAGL